VTGSRVSVVIADDQRLVAEALEAILSTDGRITGSTAEQDVSRARSAGAAGYATKDHNVGDLVPTILDAATR
jgi:DNA-binding NarL/FixJ family response regulator